MNKKSLSAIILSVIILLFLFEATATGQAGAQLDAAAVALEVLNPRGEIEPTPVRGISPRLKDLDGKKIGLYDNGKTGFAEFLDEIERLLKERYSDITVLRYNGAFDLGDKMAGEIASEVDAFIYGSAD